MGERGLVDCVCWSWRLRGKRHRRAAPSADLHTRLYHTAINTQMGFTGGELGRCGRGTGPRQGCWKSVGLPFMSRRKLLIKLNLGFYTGRSSGCSSQASAVAAVQSGSANHSSTSEEKKTFEIETWCLMTNVCGKLLLSRIIYGEPFITAFHLEAYFG